METEIAIVGAGICGLATALALHRKGIKCVVVERSESLRATGLALTIFTNGWRVLDQLGVASKLRPFAITIHTLYEKSLDDNFGLKIPVSNEELRCLKRSLLIEALAAELPTDTIYFGRQVVALKLDPVTSYPLLKFQDGSLLRAKVVIGCDGANSIVAEYLGLKAPKLLSMCSTLGFTNYPDGHGLDNESIIIRKGGVSVGRIPMDDKLVYWFVAREQAPKDLTTFKDTDGIRESAIESVMDFPDEIVEMVKISDANSLILARLKYQTPWEILLGNFRKGAVVVAGDAMHVVAPFLGQGGSVCLEDAVVLARCLAKHVEVSANQDGHRITKGVEAGLDLYVKERRMRLVWLSTQSYLIGLLGENSSNLVRRGCLWLLATLFPDTLWHTRYNCADL
ncbi:hypothetical protein K2173_009068 [Erythroxylum novogranatense]|uniref:FAD-binding domain-containing protein n=1 Tax=Erythroxylum novogranatense TaxID=1862640 RepID=A0AAV8TSP7_9ROSI|nr:hypothetical protein K2173_009068 [Erythroxylum novogranatense]